MRGLPGPVILFTILCILSKLLPLPLPLQLQLPLPSRRLPSN